MDLNQILKIQLKSSGQLFNGLSCLAYLPASVRIDLSCPAWRLQPLVGRLPEMLSENVFPPWLN